MRQKPCKNRIFVLNLASFMSIEASKEVLSDIFGITGFYAFVSGFELRDLIV